MKKPKPKLTDYSNIVENLPNKSDLNEVRDKWSHELDDDDKVVCFIPDSERIPKIIFTDKKIIVEGTKEGFRDDIILPLNDIDRVEINRPDRLFFKQERLMFEFKGINFSYKSEDDGVEKFMFKILL